MRGRARIRPWLRTPRRRGPRPERGGGRLLPLVLGVGLALGAILWMDAALGPTVTALARAKAESAVTRIVNDVVSDVFASEAVSYGELMTVEKDAAGQVALLTADTARLNALRTEILDEVLTRVEALDSQTLGVPLGSLTGLTSLAALGPVLPVRVVAAAVPAADFENVFASAGINQTLHRIMLNVRVECTLLLPGGRADAAVEAQVCAAETLLVGRVPDAYLELPGSS